MQQSGPLLEFGTDASPVLPAAPAEKLAAEKCMPKNINNFHA
jgi:hypothetical protein